MNQGRMVALMLVLVSMAGCTSESARLAISNYEQTAHHQHVAFNNVYRIASENLFLATAQQVSSSTTAEQRLQAIELAWKAQRAIEEARVQYIMGRSMSMLTVGQYLYDQQGWMNALFGDRAGMLGRTTEAIEKGNQAAGVDSFWEVVPDVVEEQILGPGPSPEAPAAPTAPSLKELLDQFDTD